MAGGKSGQVELPERVGEFIDGVVASVKGRQVVRDAVRAELVERFWAEQADIEGAVECEERGDEFIQRLRKGWRIKRLVWSVNRRCRRLWVKIVSAVLLIFSVSWSGLLVGLCIYGAWVDSLEPVLRVDYLEEINKIGRGELTEEENAWSDYQRAIEIFVEPECEVKEWFSEVLKDSGNGVFSSGSEDNRARFLRWIDDNEGARAALLSGAMKKGLYFEYEYSEGALLWMVNLPDFTKIRSLVKQVLWLNRRTVANGERGGALDKIMAVMNVGRHLKDQKMFCEQLCGEGISSLACLEIIRLGVGAGLDETAEIEMRWKAFYPKHHPKHDYIMERMFWRQAIECFYSEGGWGGGVILWDECLEDDELYAKFSYSWLGLMTLLHIKRDEAEDRFKAYFDILDKRLDEKPFVYRNRAYPVIPKRSKKICLESFRYMLFYQIGWLPDNVPEINHRMRVDYEAAGVVLSVFRWQKEKGEFPDDLAELVAGGYLAAVPEDPYAEGKLKYRRDEGGFVLYSVGIDYEDGGGVADKDYLWGHDYHGGDRVFWPLVPFSRDVEPCE